MKTLRRFAITIGIAVICLALFLALRFINDPAALLALFNPASQIPPRQRITLQTLRTEALAFLVTERIVTQVVVEEDRSSFWLGTDQGVLVATARLYYGIDLAQLNEDDLIDNPDQPDITITLPRPAFLDAAIDPDYHVVTKRSGLMHLRDFWTGQEPESRLRSKIERAAYTFAKEKSLIPPDTDILTRVNGIAATLSAKAGKPVIFKYRPPPPLSPAKPEQNTRPIPTSE